MWLEWMEGFDWAANSAELADRYEGGSWALKVGSGRGGGNSANDPSNARWNFSVGGQTEFLMGFALKPILNFTILNIRQNITNMIHLRSTSEGRFQLRRGSYDVLGTSAPVLQSDKFSYITVQMKIDNNVGLLNVWVNGSLEFSATDVDTEESAGGIGNIEFQFGEFDDMYLYLGSGASTATPLGDISVPAATLDGDGDDSNFTPVGDTSNYQCVDDAAPDGDTTYCISDTVGHRDLFTFADVPVFVGSIKAVNVLALLRKDDVGGKTAKIVCKSGATVYDGSTEAALDDYNWFDHIWEQDPDTAAEWLLTGMNAAQFGLEVVS